LVRNRRAGRLSPKQACQHPALRAGTSGDPAALIGQSSLVTSVKYARFNAYSDFAGGEEFSGRPQLAALA
jgi:hypothetical protein